MLCDLQNEVFEVLQFVFRSLETEPTGAERVSNTKSQRKQASIC